MFVNNNIVSSWNLSSWVVFLAVAGLLVVPYGTVLCLIFLFLMGTYYLIKNGKNIKLMTSDKLMIFALFFFFITIFPAFISEGFRFRYVDTTLRYFLAIPALIYLIQAKPSGDSIFLGGIVGSILAFVFAIYQYYYLGMPRVDGFLFSINFGYLACSLSFISLFGAIYFKNNKMKVLSVIGFCLGLYAMALTLTRGAYIAVPVLFFAMLLLYARELGVKKLLASFALFFVFVGLIYTSVPEINSRMGTLVGELVSYEQADEKLKNSSSGLRLELWRGAFEAFKVSPLFGLNYSERERLNKKLIEDGVIVSEIARFRRGHAHSDYFEVLATRGGVGLASLFCLYLIPLVIYYRRFLKTQGRERALASAGIVFVLGFMVFGLSEAPLQSNTISAYVALAMAAMYSSLRGDNLQYER